VTLSRGGPSLCSSFLSAMPLHLNPQRLNTIVAVVVGVASGYYIFNPAAKELGARLAAAQQAAQSTMSDSTTSPRASPPPSSSSST
jgi:hypothetical protein